MSLKPEDIGYIKRKWTSGSECDIIGVIGWKQPFISLAFMVYHL